MEFLYRYNSVIEWSMVDIWYHKYMMRNKRILSFLFFVAVSCTGLADASAKPVVLDRIVASIQGAGVITDIQLVQYAAVRSVFESGYHKSMQEQLNDRQFMKTTLDMLIDRTLMLKDAQLLSIIQPGQEKVKNMVAQFRAKFNSENDFKDYLNRYAITPDYLNKYMTDELIVRQYLNDEIKMLVKVSNHDIEQYYENNKNAYNGISKKDAEKDIKALLLKKEYGNQLKSWIKTLTLNREIIIMY
ncbi:MAG: SurA N-terminal domain-containing protein [Deltaproteobacteria bacterium]|nr:SurA N-terminal domain-containing protein [Deltaproteobacteria bacterium]